MINSRWLVAFLIVIPPSPVLSKGRPFEVQDLLRKESIQQAKLSPDGSWLAYVRIRPRTESETYQRPWLDGKDRADIWLVATNGGRPRNLTQGVSDGSGFWLPIWSPDSKKFVLLSTRGGNVRLWLFDVASGTLKRLTEQGVRYWGEGHVIDSPANIRDMWRRIFSWIDECLTIQRPVPTGSKFIENLWTSREHRDVKDHWRKANPRQLIMGIVLILLVISCLIYWRSSSKKPKNDY